MIRYYAYGSNMLTERLLGRCASARTLGVASAQGFRVSFAKRGRDGSGKATLETAAPDDIVHGVLFEMSDFDIIELDRVEGVGMGYERRSDFPVLWRGEVVAAEVYIADAEYIDLGLEPFDWYHALVLAGATQHRLPEGYLEKLASVGARPDPEPDREGRREALALLRQTGFRSLPEY